ncbi:MAG: 2-amino-4-hydroxy-6-hydroxymethyldihydropteridine diphosphokinase [Planctomycetota bacterium]|nr:2-amino-4-hydroxy-6-hydroxymethyldihydropteridine diphosphokinase [Planctomycetota bacterium]MDG1984654.1 2-amino-4-hydroxy-6-hydroxymethyldihydropteridine diphosphokinase [Planctomycetota bacterium]
MSESRRRRFPKGRDESPEARLVIIGLGSNVDAPTKLNAAVDEISYEYDLLARSTRYVSPAMPSKKGNLTAPEPTPSPGAAPAPEEAAPYSNAAVLIRTVATHDAIKETLGEIEARLGRDRRQPDCVAIDLDILLIQDEVIREGRRTLVPHPDLETRRYVAIPGAEVAPFMRHPITKAPLAEIAAALA